MFSIPQPDSMRSPRVRQRKYPGGYIPGENPAMKALEEALGNQLWIGRDLYPQWSNNDRDYRPRDGAEDGALFEPGEGQPEAGPSSHPSAYGHPRTNHIVTKESHVSPVYYNPAVGFELPGPEQPQWIGQSPDANDDTTPPARQGPPQVFRAARSFQPNAPEAFIPISPRSVRVPSPSDPYPPTLQLNKFLEPRPIENIWDIRFPKPNVDFDLRRPHDAALMYGYKHVIPVSPGLGEQPATIPPCNYMRIVHPDILWPIHVRAGTYLHPASTFTGRKAKHWRFLDYCSVLDVLKSIYETLHVPMTRTEFYFNTKEEQKCTAMAFYQRCRYMIADPSYGNQEEKGARRVDWLGVKVQFIGLVPTRGYGRFKMVLADRERERADPRDRQVDLLMPLQGEPEAAGYQGIIPWGWRDPRTTWGHLTNEDEPSKMRMRAQEWTRSNRGGRTSDSETQIGPFGQQLSGATDTELSKGLELEFT